MLSRRNSIYEIILKELKANKYPQRNFIFLLLSNQDLSKYKRQTIANAVQKLKKEKLIRVGVDALMVSARAIAYIEKRKERLRLFDSPFSKKSPKNLLVLFDIPEDRKGEREWFRRQLIEFGYEMVQKSVWLGPSPLPKDFVRYVKTIGLGENIKTFKIAPKQNISSIQKD
ncbi:MAG TPA: CRISPR-associated endonuclease Cas2 [Candidatus Paceibacterota bacterium]|nr:CRISPR-associated endonuclease Cas2 [Candidatus Paceibacterota bacterium]